MKEGAKLPVQQPSNISLDNQSSVPEKRGVSREVLYAVIGVLSLGIVGVSAVAAYLWLNRDETDGVASSEEQEVTADEEDTEEVAAEELEDSAEVVDTGDSDVLPDGWVQYENTAYNYQLLYPEGWNAGAYLSDDIATGDMLLFEKGCDYEGGERCPQVAVSIGSVFYENLEDYVLVTEGVSKLNSQEYITVDGEEALRAEVLVNYEGYMKEYQMVQVTVYVNHGGNTYRIGFTENGNDRSTILSSAQWEYNDTFDTILESFSFTD